VLPKKEKKGTFIDNNESSQTNNDKKNLKKTDMLGMTQQPDKGLS
jgi:hypothetical protein